MLTTSDFGLLAMIAIFTAVAYDLSNCGLADGIIHKANPTDTDYSTVFVFNGALGLFFGLSFFLGAPLVARFFGHEELIGIMRVLGVCFFFQTLSLIQETRLRKELKLKTICFVHVGSTITVSTLAIWAAANGYGYKALICTQILLSLVVFIFYAFTTRWFPRIRFSIKSFKELFSYGWHLLLSYLCNLISVNVNTSFLGRYYPSPSMSGIYFQGAKLAAVPFKVSESSLNWPFFAVAANETDPSKRRQLICNMFSTILGINGTLTLFLLVIVSPGIRLLYGDQWLGAIPIFRILALAQFFIALRNFFQTICKVHGSTFFIRNMAFVELTVQLLLLFAFYRQGIVWIAWTQSAGVFLSVTIYSLYCRKFMGMGMRQLLSSAISTLSLPAIAAIAGTGTAIALSSSSPLVGCIAIAIVFAAVVIALGEWKKPAFYLSIRRKLIKY